MPERRAFGCYPTKQNRRNPRGCAGLIELRLKRCSLRSVYEACAGRLLQRVRQRLVFRAVGADVGVAVDVDAALARFQELDQPSPTQP